MRKDTLPHTDPFAQKFRQAIHPLDKLAQNPELSRNAAGYVGSLSSMARTIGDEALTVKAIDELRDELGVQLEAIQAANNIAAQEKMALIEGLTGVQQELKRGFSRVDRVAANMKSGTARFMSHMFDVTTIAGKVSSNNPIVMGMTKYLLESRKVAKDQQKRLLQLRTRARTDLEKFLQRSFVVQKKTTEAVLKANVPGGQVPSAKPRARMVNGKWTIVPDKNQDPIVEIRQDVKAILKNLTGNRQKEQEQQAEEKEFWKDLLSKLEPANDNKFSLKKEEKSGGFNLLEWMGLAGGAKGILGMFKKLAGPMKKIGLMLGGALMKGLKVIPGLALVLSAYEAVVGGAKGYKDRDAMLGRKAEGGWDTASAAAGGAVGEVVGGIASLFGEGGREFGDAAGKWFAQFLADTLPNMFKDLFEWIKNGAVGNFTKTVAGTYNAAVENVSEGMEWTANTVNRAGEKLGKVSTFSPDSRYDRMASNPAAPIVVQNFNQTSAPSQSVGMMDPSSHQDPTRIKAADRAYQYGR